MRMRANGSLATVLGNDKAYMCDTALASGAQIVSTDFPSYELTSRCHVDYAVRFEGGGVVRCNLVTGGAGRLVA